MIIKFPQKVLLWASGYETSKVVFSLQEKCNTAPHCLGGENEWINPFESPSKECPYGFDLRKECIEHRNRAALEAALFTPKEAKLLTKFLGAMGYSVREEQIDTSKYPLPILKSHGHVGSEYDVDLIKSPVGQLILIRENISKGMRHGTS